MFVEDCNGQRVPILCRRCMEHTRVTVCAFSFVDSLELSRIFVLLVVLKFLSFIHYFFIGLVQ